jgi:predicted 3-demethylubiquinone-9 3-methyltransferase (glyoxalase superfamily)
MNPAVAGADHLQPKVRPFLMFQGAAQEALKFYVSLFPQSVVGSVTRYGPASPVPKAR